MFNLKDVIYFLLYLSLLELKKTKKGRSVMSSHHDSLQRLDIVNQNHGYLDHSNSKDTESGTLVKSNR